MLAILVIGPLGAATIVALPAAAHLLRSPDRTLDGLYIAAFCGLGLLTDR